MSWSAGRRKDNDSVGIPILTCDCRGKSFPHIRLLKYHSCLVVDYLSEHIRAKDSAIVYYYFDYKSQQPHSDVVGVLIKQFCLLKATIPQAVLDLYGHGAEDEQWPSLSSLLVVLQLLAAEFKQSYIILDALD